MKSEHRRYMATELPESARTSCKEILEALQRGVSGLVGAGVVGPDGFEVAAVFTKPIEIPKISALSSTMVAVADAFTTEAGLNACREVILECNGSNVLLFAIPVLNVNFSLFAIADHTVTLGRILSQGRLCIPIIRDALSAGRGASA